MARLTEEEFDTFITDVREIAPVRGTLEVGAGRYFAIDSDTAPMDVLTLLRRHDPRCADIDAVRQAGVIRGANVTWYHDGLAYTYRVSRIPTSLTSE